jgi:hypothetical protein
MYFEWKLLRGEAVVWSIGCIVKGIEHHNIYFELMLGAVECSAVGDW